MWYQIDAVDRIAAVCTEWDPSVVRNDAPRLRGATVIGRPIWSFLDGTAARFHYANLFETVRQTGVSTQLRLRADGPRRQTLCELDIIAKPNQSLLITVKTLRDRAVSYVPLWDKTLPRSAALVVACSWCKAIKIGDDWTSALNAGCDRDDIRSNCPPAVVHQICPSCDHTLIRERRAAFSGVRAV